MWGPVRKWHRAENVVGQLWQAAPPLTAMTVPAAAEGRPFHQIRVCQSMQMPFFRHPVLTPPLPLPPQTQIDFEDRK
jgi:hypothetical protein